MAKFSLKYLKIRLSEFSKYTHLGLSVKHAKLVCRPRIVEMESAKARVDRCSRSECETEDTVMLENPSPSNTAEVNAQSTTTLTQ